MPLPPQTVDVFLTGVGVGFLGGLFGKGGSAIATPILALIGLPGYVALAAPLPATIPGTFVASLAYWRSGEIDWDVVLWSLAWGMPATAAGAWLSDTTGSKPLILITAALVLGFGVSFIVKPGKDDAPASVGRRPRYWTARLLVIASAVGFVSGLLANAGGFLLVPCYAKFLKLRIKTAFACSLAVSMVLAVPGTLVHSRLGHIDWLVVLVMGLGSVPCSYLGARVALKSRSATLARVYGVALTLLGVFSLWQLK